MFRPSQQYCKLDRYESDLLSIRQFIDAIKNSGGSKINIEDLGSLVNDKVIFPLVTIRSNIVVRRIPCGLTNHLFMNSSFYSERTVNKPIIFVDSSMYNKELERFYTDNYEGLKRSNWGDPADEERWPTDVYITSGNKAYIDTEYYKDILTTGYADISAFLMPDITRNYPLSPATRYYDSNWFYHEYMSTKLDQKNIEEMRIGNAFQSNDPNHKKPIIYPSIEKNILAEAELQYVMPYAAFEAFKFLHYYLTGIFSEKVKHEINKAITQAGIDECKVAEGKYNPERAEDYYDIVDRMTPVILDEMRNVYENYNDKTFASNIDPKINSGNERTFRALLSLSSVLDIWVPFYYAEKRLRVTQENIYFTKDQVSLAMHHLEKTKIDTRASVTIRKRREVYYKYCIYRHFTAQIIAAYDKSTHKHENKNFKYKDAIDIFIDDAAKSTKFRLYNDKNSMIICEPLGGGNAIKDYDESISVDDFIDKHLRFGLDYSCDEYPDIVYSVAIKTKTKKSTS